jgi:FkbM family methyltransferase
MAAGPIERLLIYFAKKLNVDLLTHAHVQAGLAGYNDLEHTGEKQLLAFLAKKDVTVNTLFDAGTNDGTYSLLLTEIFPNASIHAFEPVPDTYRIAEKTLNGKPNVSLHRFGLYRENCTLDIYNDSNNPNSQISTVYADGLVDFYATTELQRLKIDVKTLDSFCEENGISNIDFIKIDVEGAELSVLQGAENMIRNNGIKIVQFEFNDFNISSRTFMQDFYKLLKGYRFFRITAKGLVNMGAYSTNHEIFKYQNVLAVHPSVAGFQTSENIFF